MLQYAEILLPQKVGQDKDTLTYELPAEFNWETGQIVEVPLRQHQARGIIYRTHQIKPPYRTRPVGKIIDNAPHLKSWQIELIDWISQYYLCSKASALKLFLPSFVKKKRLHSFEETENPFMELKYQHKLTPQQQEVLSKIKSSNKKVALLHGITGSGKTEIYLHIAQECVNKGQQVLMLIPEISLSPQMKERVESHFNEKTAVIHSQLTPKQKEQAWQSIATGEAKIIIGSRSALFAPFKNLAHIIMDEEHDHSYKQDSNPRYHALGVAEKMAELLNIKILLGSATPSVETYYKAQNQEYELLELATRPTQNQLPHTHIVDLREELKKKNFSIFSEKLQLKMAQQLEQKQQSLLFLNRRGAASAVICRVCGFVKKCDQCDIPMTYHRRLTVENGIYAGERLICHHCGLMAKVPLQCPTCDSAYIKYIGLGTQRIEEDLQKLYPEARILRADRDTTQKRDQFQQLYQQFKKGEADMLVGTQMIALGLHLPKVNLVGVILADMGLMIPNFRSAERTFQLITQVVGRAGRDETQGEAVIQTYLPDHYAITAAAAQNYRQFYDEEIQIRREHHNPPFTQLIKITFRDKSETACRQKALKLSNELEQLAAANSTTDPSTAHTINHYPALIPKLKNIFRWHVLLTGPAPHKLLSKAKNTLDAMIDVDPTSTV